MLPKSDDIPSKIYAVGIGRPESLGPKSLWHESYLIVSGTGIHELAKLGRDGLTEVPG